MLDDVMYSLTISKYSISGVPESITGHLKIASLKICRSLRRIEQPVVVVEDTNQSS